MKRARDDFYNSIEVMFTTKVQKSNVKDSNVKIAKIGVFAAV